MGRVPFYPNTKDNTHCYQAALRMVLGYFIPEKKYSIKELEKFTAKKPALWTWPTQALINFYKLGFEVKKKSTFDYKKFIKNKGRYLTEKYGKEMGEAQIKNSDIAQEVRLAKEYIGIFGNKILLPTLKELRQLLNEGYLIIVNLNYYSLYNKKGYAGYFVVLYRMDGKNVYFHDPGLPPKPKAIVSIKNFVEAWEYPTKDSRNYSAFKLTRFKV